MKWIVFTLIFSGCAEVQTTPSRYEKDAHDCWASYQVQRGPDYFGKYRSMFEQDAFIEHCMASKGWPTEHRFPDRDVGSYGNR